MFSQRLKNKMTGPASDSILLTFVHIVTSLVGIIVTKLLSVHFSLTEYGTYSQGMLIVTTVSTFTILGLTNAVNYFYNNTTDEEMKRCKIATIFTLQYCIGLFAAIIILLIQRPIIRYFDNEQLKGALIIIAFMPLFQNLIPMLQVLFVSIGKAKLIAIRNLIISIARLVIVFVLCFISKNIVQIFWYLIILDIIQVLLFLFLFSRIKFPIRISDAKREFLKPILAFSLPMAVYLLTNSLSRDLDKYVISYMSNTETLAIYSIAAKVLPFDMITSSFITVLIPIITRQIGTKKYNDAEHTFRAYLRLGYIATWIMCFGAIVLSKELLLFLYDEKYLPGLSVFIVYLFVDMMKFANTSVLLVAKGKTSTLMKCSISALICNLAFNIVSFKLIGIIGPAVVTLFITFMLTVALICFGAKEIESSVWRFFDWKEVLVIILQLLIVGLFVFIINMLLERIGLSYVLRLIICYGIYISLMSVLNYKRIIQCLKDINALK